MASTLIPSINFMQKTLSDQLLVESMKLISLNI